LIGFQVFVVEKLFSESKKLLAFAGHHWVGKGMPSLILFWVFSIVFSRGSEV
jgi:hypothetical protein